jgi:hypothetical protein
MELVTIRHRAHDGRVTETRDAGGGVFYPLPEKNVKMPVWLYGPGKSRVFYSCPVSSIPQEVTELYYLWTVCRLTQTLPLAGGFLDQPAFVQAGFPIFAVEYDLMQRATHQASPSPPTS